MNTEIKIYFSEELNKEVLELNDNPILRKITNPELTELAWMDICEEEAQKFKLKFGTELYYCGRMGRHVCVDNIRDNRRWTHYRVLCRYVEDRQKKIVERINNYNSL